MIHLLRTVLFASAPLAILLSASLLVADERKLNEPPPGFTAVFNGKDLSGWKGLGHFNPQELRKLSPEERAKKEAADREDAARHWTVENGELVNDGHGAYLTTEKDYGDFELWIDYKTVPKADSGIYLRGTPQVQIWDSTEEAKFKLGADKGSGGLWNNAGEGKHPFVLADKPFGEWNSFRIKMVGESVTVYLNDQLVVNDAPLDNFWEKGKPVYPVGPIQLQTHGGEIRWRNVFIREIPRKPPEAGVLDKNGTPVGDGWRRLDEEQAASAEASSGNAEYHAYVTLPSADATATVKFRTSGDAGYELTLNQRDGGVLEATQGDDRRKVADYDGGSLIVREGRNHLYLRTRADYIEAWLNGTKVIDVLDPSGPKAGTAVFGGSFDNVFVRPTTDWRDRPATESDEQGFVPLFNGKDLTGWNGAVEGHTVENGVLVSPAGKGGNLYTDKEYKDFVLRFDFKLESGANNGVGLRAERGKDAAYYGMESQILDNTAPGYAGLAPYQYHGSIYGVLPARRGYQKPLGHWNSQEISVNGSHVTVTLNGETIVDGDIEKVGKPKTIDGKNHPGLFNEKGYIGFLGHGHRIEFRNIRIKELN